MGETIFTKILDGSIPSYKIYEDDNVYAFLDISPAAVGHTLVIPKVNPESVLDADDLTRATTFNAAAKLANHIKDALGATGINLLTNAGADAGQMVMHWHIHIIPRFADDGVGNFNFDHKVEKPNMQAFFEETQATIQTDTL